MTLVPSEDSDRPGHPLSLISVFAVCMKKGWVLSYWLTHSEDWSDWVHAQADLSLCWVHVILLVESCTGYHECHQTSLYSSDSGLALKSLNHSSHRCGLQPSSGHVRQAKFCLRVVRCFFFLGISHFGPTLRLTGFSIREIILIGCKTERKKKKMNKSFLKFDRNENCFVCQAIKMASQLTDDRG